MVLLGQSKHIIGMFVDRYLKLNYLYNTINKEFSKISLKNKNLYCSL